LEHVNDTTTQNAARTDSNDRWGRILKNSFDEIYVFDSESLRFIQVSRGALLNLGYSLAQMLQLTPVDIKPDLDTAQFEALLLPLRRHQQELVVFETRHQRMDGSFYPVEVRLQLAQEAPRSVFVAIIHDITERLRVQREVLESEQRFQVLAHISPVGIFRTDARGDCIDVNERWLQIAGMTLPQALGEGWVNAIHPEDRQRVFSLWRESARSNTTFRTQCRFLRSDGKITWVLAQAARESDTEGNTLGYVGTTTDISKLKQTEEDLAKSISEWNVAMDQFEDAVVLVDLNETIIRANKTFYRETGLTPAEVIGHSPVDIYHPQGEKIPCPVCRARKERRDFRAVIEADNPDNIYGRPVEKTVRVLRDPDGAPQSIMVVTHDLSRQRAIEEELREHRDRLEELVESRTRELAASNKELESYSYSIAHDLRAPLRAIVSFSQIVMDEAAPRLSQQEKDYLQRVIGSGAHMSDIIDDILELSRVSRMDFARESVDLSELARSCVSRLQESDPGSPIRVEIETGLTAQGDPRLLAIMLNNLLNNAWKYSGKTPQPHIEFGAKQQGDKTVYYVKDNGVGFDMKYVGKLFGVFQRLHSANEFEGTGIGLATVQRIIERHGGRVWAEAKPNRGACFFFTLD
jgi:PAS domain S-box-containing protein